MACAYNYIKRYGTCIIYTSTFLATTFDFYPRKLLWQGCWTMFQFLGIESLMESLSGTSHPTEVEHPHPKCFGPWFRAEASAVDNDVRIDLDSWPCENLWENTRNSTLLTIFSSIPGIRPLYIYYIIYIRIYTYIMPRFFLVDQCWRYRIRKYYGYNMIQADSICTVNLSKLSNISRSFYGHVIGSREAPFCCSSQLRCPRCSVVFFVIQAFAGENTLVT